MNFQFFSIKIYNVSDIRALLKEISYESNTIGLIPCICACMYLYICVLHIDTHTCMLQQKGPYLSIFSQYLMTLKVIDLYK